MHVHKADYDGTHDIETLEKYDVTFKYVKNNLELK